DAKEKGIAECTLVGDGAAIRGIAEENGIDISDMAIIDEPDPKAAAHKAMELVSSGRAQLAMKGRVKTADFLRAALDKEMGLRTGRLLSHVAIFDIPGFDRLLFISDAGMVVAPTLEQKVDIIRNAVYVAHRLGLERPKVAVLAAAETVDPDIPATVEAASLAKMADRGQIKGAIVDGPLALDNAVSLKAAKIKGVKSEVAGRADILIAPDIEAGNMMAKAIIYFAKGPMAGVVVGAKCPLIVPSRSDPREAKLASIALGVLVAS
ncbi:MAG: bifunctional enoyl-CoA hydratase/phosphate acetyltransferase, partial [Chloroflexota bacterium]|nr:bifunctional enoyl-CoA hydratase/phosphate acetyltransferase [Chloroflexota bacterium]